MKRHIIKRLVLILPIALFTIISCDMKKSEINSNDSIRSMNQPTIGEIDLKKSILYNGDTNAYDKLSISYLDHSIQEEFLFYALIMANKYDYPQAYFDVYFYLTQTFSNDINNMDEHSAKLAIDYLLKAKEKGHHQAKDIVEEYSITNMENSKQQIERIFME